MDIDGTILGCLQLKKEFSFIILSCMQEPQGLSVFVIQWPTIGIIEFQLLKKL